MKKLFLFAAAAMLLAACSDSDNLAQDPQQNTAADDGAVTFSAYMQRSTTRAGKTGGIDNTTLQAADAGFGVFAYYTDNFDYTPLYVPNFMYNEKVYYSGGAYNYDLTKYWPNEHGSQAQSADMDRVSFFAYAPYVEADPTTGLLAEGGTLLEASDDKLQWGITGMKRNTLQGDPVIQYIASFDQAKCVDLCWGTTGSSAVTWGTNGTTQTIAAGYPWLNVRKPNGVAGDDSKVKFVFQHALAKLNVTVKTDFSGDWTETDAAKTKVWVRSIRFTGIARKGALNLNNPKTMAPNKARWIDYYGSNELELGESVTVYDGRRNGSEGMTDAVAPNEAVLGLNPQIVQVENQIEGSPAAWKTSGEGVQPGVTTTAVNAFCNGTAPATSIYVIPTGERVTVEITYDVETIDPKLPTVLSDGETYGTSVENCISKSVTFGTSTTTLESGKSYTLNLILGMKDVKFTAEVNESWEDGGTADVYLPNNMYSVAAGATTITVPYNTTTISDFFVTGLTAGQTPTVTPDGTYVTAATADPATVPASGEIKITGITMTGENATVAVADAGSITITQSDPSLTTTVNVKRAGKPFVFKDIDAITAGDDKTFDIEAGATSGTVTTAQWAAATVTVEKQTSGSSTWTALTLNDSSDDSDNGTYKRANNTAKITISDLDGLAAGDKIRVTIKVGDVTSVSYVINVVAS
mgnify:CR=1 FL=1